MRFASVLSVLVFLFPIFVKASPSEEFWNPFRDSKTNFQDTIKGSIKEVMDEIKVLVGRTVSIFKIPSLPSSSETTQYKKTSYNAATLKNTYSVASPNLSIQDTSDDGEVCGGKSGDPYWANDCSCRCSKGELSNVKYEVSDRCPEDDNLTCEDCRKITKHDNTYTKVSQCKEGF